MELKIKDFLDDINLEDIKLADVLEKVNFEPVSKEEIIEALDDEVIITKRELALGAVSCVLLGVVIGLLKARPPKPPKHPGKHCCCHKGPEFDMAEDVFVVEPEVEVSFEEEEAPKKCRKGHGCGRRHGEGHGRGRKGCCCKRGRRRSRR